MKMNVIALAVVAAMAAPLAAQADVKLSGQIKLTVADVTDSNTKQMAPAFDNTLKIAASEDIGGGNTMFASHTIDLDGNGAASAGVGAKDSVIGVKTAMGTVVGGRMETLMEGKISSMMDDGMSAHGANGQLESSAAAWGRVNALAYVSPAFSGVTVALAGVLNGASSDIFTHKDIAIMYKNGPLSVNAGYTVTATAAPGVPGLGADVRALSASYKMGAAKVSGMFIGTEDGNDTILRLDYTMGKNVILVGHKIADTDAGYGDDVTTLKLTHKFSKTAMTYVGFRSKAASAAGNVLFFGAKKKF